MMTKEKEYNILPTTPTLLKKLNIKSPKYMEARQKELDKKIAKQIYNDKLRPYQNDAVYFLVNSNMPGLALFDEQRLGKTPTVLTALKVKHAIPIIIVPKSILYQWYDEYKKWYNDDVILVDGTKPQRLKAYQTTKALIMSYNTAATDIDYIVKLKHINHIVIDEAHRIRNIKKSEKYKPQIASAIIKLSKKIPYKIALSGTPASNYADDIYGILYFLYPSIFRSYYTFSNYYFKSELVYTKQNDRVKTIEKNTGEFKPGMKEELLEFLELISMQRKRKDVMQWLPKYNITKVEIPMENEQLKAHINLKTYFEYKNKICLDILSLITALRTVAVAPQLLDCEVKGCKFNYVLDYIEDYKDKSIIIVSNFVEPLKSLSDNIKIPHKIIIGSTSANKRNEIKKEFQSKKFRILLANLNVIKEGFTLDTADVIIFLDSSYVYTDNIQCMDRLVPTTKNKVHENVQEIILLVAKESIDEYIYDMVYIKKATSLEIINNYAKLINMKGIIQ